jgi:hypothetical protein
MGEIITEETNLFVLNKIFCEETFYDGTRKNNYSIRDRVWRPIAEKIIERSDSCGRYKFDFNNGKNNLRYEGKIEGVEFYMMNSFDLGSSYEYGVVDLGFSNWYKLEKPIILREKKVISLTPLQAGIDDDWRELYVREGIL